MSAKRKRKPPRGPDGRFVKRTPAAGKRSSSSKTSKASGRPARNRGGRTASSAGNRDGAVPARKTSKRTPRSSSKNRNRSSKAPAKRVSSRSGTKSARAKEAQRRTERRTTSRRIAGRKGTVPHFKRWASGVILDTGEPWPVEDWQAELVGEILGGVPIVWEVVPEGNGKTTLSAGVGLYHLDPDGWGIARPRIVIAAHTSKQAEWLYGQAEGMVGATPDLAAKFRTLGGFKRIERRDYRLARLDVFAGDDAAADGAIYTLAFVEELHRHKDLRLYRVWIGKGRKRKGQVVVTSTAGEPNSEFEESRMKIIENAKGTGNVKIEGEYDSHVRAQDGRVVLHDYAVRDPENAHDLKVVKEANPFSGATLEGLAENHDDPTMTWEHFLRFSCNIPTRVEGQAWTAAQWKALGPQEGEEALSPSSGSWKIGFLDLGWEIDCTAMGIIAWESRELRLITSVKILEPPVDEGDIVEGLVYRQREFGPTGWVYDPHAGGQQMVQLLEKREHPRQEGTEFTFIEHSQDNAPMSLAAQRLDEAIRQGWIRHDGDRGLEKHVMNAVRKGLGGDKWKIDRPPTAKGRRRKLFPIDALTGVLIGHSVAVTQQTTRPELIASFGKAR